MLALLHATVLLLRQFTACALVSGCPAAPCCLAPTLACPPSPASCPLTQLLPDHVLPAPCCSNMLCSLLPPPHIVSCLALRSHHALEAGLHRLTSTTTSVPASQTHTTSSNAPTSAKFCSRFVSLCWLIATASILQLCSRAWKAFVSDAILKISTLPLRIPRLCCVNIPCKRCSPSHSTAASC